MGTIATSRSLRALHRVFRQRVVAPTQPLNTWIVQSLWLGLASGWLETGVILAHRALVGTVTTTSVRFNHYHVALGLLAHLAIFAFGMGLVALLSNRWTRRWWRDPMVTLLGWFLAFLSPMLALEELHWASSAILAAALAGSLGPWWLRHRGMILRVTLLPLAVGSAMVGGASFALVRYSESRALAILPPARPGTPNVVLLVLDTVRADHLSLHGYPRPTTPRLDALARHSVCFLFARSPAPWTLPSHATMFTGRWPHELSVDYDRPLDGSYPTLAEVLSRHGYLTGGFVGNTFYANSWFGLDRGFARYEDAVENETISAQEAFRTSALIREWMPLAVSAGLWPSDGRYTPRKSAEQVNRDALAWLDRRAVGGRPFFLFLNYIDAHGPYTLPDDFPRQFSKSTNRELREASRKASNPRLPVAERHEAIGRIGVNAYDDGIRYIDLQIGRFLEELDRRGLRRNTWVIVTADHGEHFGEHGLFTHGNSLYRPLVNVPLLIVPPEDSPARRVLAPVSLRDLPATVLDLVGLASASPFPGRSLRRHWDETRSASDPIDAPVSEWKIPAGTSGLPTLPLRDRTRTAIVDQRRIYHRDPLGPEALYDLSDIEEARDLSEHPDERPALDHLRALGEAIRRGDR